MRRSIAIQSVALLVVAATTAHAQDQPAVRLTLEDAIGRAVAASNRLAEARAREEGAHAAIRSRQVADDPTVVVDGGYTRTNHVDEFAVPGPGGTVRIVYPDIPDNYFGRATLQWPIYTSGRTDALVRAAEAEARATTADVEVAHADLRLEVVRTYWALVTATESVRVVQEALGRADAHLRDVRSQFQVGLIPPNDVASAEAQRSREEMQLIEARNIRSSTLEELRRLTGITTEIVPDAQLSAGLPTSRVETAPIRAEQRALAERLSASEERINAIDAAARPTVAVRATADYANPNPHHFPRMDRWRTSWEVGAVVNWTLWDSGRIAAEKSEAAAATQALRHRQAETDALIATDVRQRQLDVDSARAAATAAEAGVRSAAEARRVVAERFNVGVATSTEVLDAQVALLQAELDLVRALANIKLSEARLERARGVP
jgi:outer membrane protein